VRVGGDPTLRRPSLAAPPRLSTRPPNLW